jgi:SAM-dependent methyltransferase
MSQAWSSGAAYDPFVGRWSQLVAQDFLNWLAIAPQARWADIGCGTGALTRAILADQSPAQVIGIDPSEDYLAYARQQVADEQVQFHLGDAGHLPFQDHAVDVVVAGLALNFVPQPAQALNEFRRVVRPQGTVAAYVWDYAGEMQLMRYFWDAATTLHPEDQAADEGRRFPLCQPERLRDLWQAAGLTNIDTVAIDVPTTFRDFDDYWTPFLGGQGAAPKYCMDLREAARVELREYLRSALPIMPDGSIHLIARAWAVRGSVA